MKLPLDMKVTAVANWFGSARMSAERIGKEMGKRAVVVVPFAASHDESNVGIYADAPWPDAGDGYSVRFAKQHQCTLAGMLASFQKARVVVRFGDHPLIRQLYPRDRWHWIEFENRAQSNEKFNEVLIVKGGAQPQKTEENKKECS